MLVLAKFDVRAGNQVIWTSETVEPSTLSGIEFKMIPSGLHKPQDPRPMITDTVYFKHDNQFGCAVVCSKVPADGNRDSLRTFSLAMLSPTPPFKQECFLEHELEKFMDVNDTLVISSQLTSTEDARTHPATSTHRFLQFFGPQVFEIWKAGITRQRVLLHASNASIREMCHYVYLSWYIGMIPSDVQHLLPSHRAQPVPCLYNVGLLDLTTLQALDAFIATTTDNLLLAPSKEACDVFISSDGTHTLQDAQGTTSSATWRDRFRFQKLLRELGVTVDDKQPAWVKLLARLADSTASGMLWWASAGESTWLADLSDTEDTSQLHDETGGVAMTGMFHEYTRQIIRVMVDLADESDAFILVANQDIAAMGLNPLSPQDRQLIQRFSLLWWDRPVKFTCCGWCA